MTSRKSDLSSRRSSRKVQNNSLPPSYDIYCLNFYDNGLNALRDEFIKQIKIGLRRFVFVIDVEKEILEAISYNETNRRLSKPKKPETLPTDAMSLTLMRIKDCVEEYDFVSKKIESEVSFNLLKYWQKHIPAELKVRVPKKEKAGMESNRPRNSLTSKSKSKETTDSVRHAKITCFGVTSKEHSTVGKGKPLSKRMYIKDEPNNTTVLILIIGNLKKEYYKTLLAHNQALRGIIHFLPEQCAYDILVPRPRREKYLRESIANIQNDIHSLSKRTTTKPVGIFQQQVPQMSVCLATKFASNIFDQLCWFVYDVQNLREQYSEYYVKPYHEINVKMSAGTSMHDSFQMAESLSIQGHYLKADVPAVHNDDATVYLYLESLLCTFGNPRELMTEMEVLLLANPSSSIKTKILDKIKVYANAFKSIVKLTKCEKLFVEESNSLLTSLISYMDIQLMRNIYHACLEYNILRRYFSSGYITESLTFSSYNGDEEPRFLPKYAKLYLTNDAVTQRIIQLINENENFKIKEIHPNVKLYTFKRCLNEVFEHEKQIVIPTRLCFRDFTLYEMEQFLQDLVTPKMFEDGIEARISALPEYPSSTYTIPNSDDNCRGNKRYIITPSIFIRPKSLKANKVAEQEKEREKEKEKIERVSSRLSRTRNDTARLSNKSLRAQLTTKEPLRSSKNYEAKKQRYNYIGLGPDHAMLTGYNLDDARQTVKVKTSKYYFTEGLLSLYEEKWNFRQMNKCLSIEIDKQVIHLTNEPKNMDATSSNVRIQTPNGINLRVTSNSKECAKAVLNYPNGLSLYSFDTHAEHMWADQQNVLNETRRICTPYGCVIVFYNGNDTVLIMRYNGEVYRLYNYIEAPVEEEEFEKSSEFINACSTQSTYSSYKPLHPRESTSLKRKKTRNCKSQTTRTNGGAEKLTIKSSLIESSSTSSQTLATKAARAEARTMQLSQTAALFNSIDGELNYLNFVTQLFDISYKHLKLTTSLGSVVHVENKENIHCGKPIRVTEWHDYYANESYSMRDDGVRMIWSLGGLKCYHSDGTVISSTTAETQDLGVIADDIDDQISSSSSHITNLNEEESANSVSKSKIKYKIKLISLKSQQIIYINVQTSDILSENELSNSVKRNKEKYVTAELLHEVEIEDQYIYDYSFTSYTPDSYNMQHKTYPGTQFFFSHINAIDLHLETRIIAADNLQFRITPFPINQKKCQDPSYPNNISHPDKSADESLSSEADSDEWTQNPNINASPNQIGPFSVEVEASNFHLWLRDDTILLNAHLRKFGCDDNVLLVRENIELKADFKQSLTTAFNNWVDDFHNFINCSCPKWRTTYFVESTTSDCRKKGFELFKNVPILGNFNFCSGNFFIDPEELKSINGKMSNIFTWYEKDMSKFPRFPTNKPSPKNVDLSSVLSTKIFVEIPAQLTYTDRIHLFVEPFDRIKFRKLKHRFNEALLFHLYPRLRMMVHQAISKRSWRNHHIENKRRLFLEQQRISLYVAMLKHKVYPNYFQFKDQFYGHVRNIDFFEFMASKCNEKTYTESYKEHGPEEELVKESTKHDTSNEQKKGRKKCLCPKYLKSLQ